MEFRETLGLEFIGDNDRIYEYFDSLEQEMLYIKFLTDPRCIKDGQVFRLATAPNEILRMMDVVPIETQTTQKRVSFSKTPKKPRQTLNLILKKKGIAKKKKVKCGSGKVGKWTKKPKKKGGVSEKSIVIPIPFTVELSD